MDPILDRTLRGWWDNIRVKGPPLPPRQPFVQAGLTVPIGNHFLTGRFHLLIGGADAIGLPAAHLFGWKTGDAKDRAGVIAKKLLGLGVAQQWRSARALLGLRGP